MLVDRSASQRRKRVNVRPLSARNPRVSSLSRLVRRPQERADQRAFVVEGPTLVGAALDADAVLIDVFVDSDAVAEPGVLAVLDRVADHVDPWVLPAGTLDRVGDAVTSQGLLAVVERRDAPWPAPDTAEFVLVLDEVSDPGNLGTLLRAATAAGAGAVVVAGGADFTSPKVVRSSAGALLAIDVVSSPSSWDAIEHLKAVGYRTLGATVHDGEPYDTIDMSTPLAIVLGNEARGLDAATIGHLDGSLTITMAGPVESLNVAMAGTILCFEVLRRRRMT